MIDSFVFNHHSLLFDCATDAERTIPHFIKLCTNIKTCLGSTVVLLDYSLGMTWFRLKLAEDYCFQDWFQANKNNDLLKDEVRAFKNMITSGPLIKDEDLSDTLGYDVLESTANQAFSTVSAAFYYKTFLCSFPTRTPWSSNPLQISVEILNDDASTTSNVECLNNFSTLHQWNQCKLSIIEKQNLSIKSSREFWDDRKSKVPFISFCGKSTSQLQSWKAGNGILTHVISALTQLSLFAEYLLTDASVNYSHELFRSNGLSFQVSGESSSVENSTKLRNLRMFCLPNGTPAYFENHIKLPDGFRIHFYVDHDKSFYVGYVGPHLKTKNF